MNSLYYGFWNYWELGHKVTFDGINRWIIINDGITDLDLQADVYSAWKEWVILEDNLKFYPPFSTVGGESTQGAERLDVSYFLINNWKFKPYSGQYDLSIVGNVFDVDGGTIKVPADIIGGDPNNISINTNTSVIVRLLTSEVSGSSGTVSVSGSISFDPETIVSASLFGIQETALYNIENRVIAIENKFDSPITASLEPMQSQSLNNIEILNVSQSNQLISLSENYATQSIQLTTLASTNVSQSQQLILLTETNVSQSQYLVSLESQLTSNNVSQSQQLTDIQTDLVDVLTIMSSTTGSNILSDNRIREIWELHGLDATKPLNVTRTARTFGGISQTILTNGTGSAQDTTITRN